MATNKAFLKFLKDIQYSSVSNINLKYNKVFKEYSIDTLIERNKFENSLQKKWLIEEENKTKAKFITTNDKLKQIINAHKNIYKIQEAFFKTFDKEPLFKKLINKENKKEKPPKKSLRIKTNKSEEKMNSLMKIKDKNREKNIEFYKRRWEENNRKPPLGLYNPRYNYIDKHIPGFNFYNDPSISKKSKSFQKIQEKKDTSVKNSSRNVSTITTSLNHSLTPLDKTKNISEFSSSIDINREKNRMNKYKLKLLALNKNQENIFLSQINIASPDKSNIENNEKEKVIQFNYTPKIVEKNIPVPIFSKMSQRFNDKKSNKGHISNADYTPNYNAVFLNVVDNKPIDYEKRKKHYYLKKIITNYNPNTEYALFPELNN